MHDNMLRSYRLQDRFYPPMKFTSARGHQLHLILYQKAAWCEVDLKCNFEQVCNAIWDLFWN